MRISEIIPLLAELLEQSPLSRSDIQKQAIAHLKAIPDFVARRRLDEWEESFPWESTRDGSKIALLIGEVYELGRYNLYCRFNPAGTLRAYAAVGAMFLEAGLSPPQVDRIQDW